MGRGFIYFFFNSRWAEVILKRDHKYGKGRSFIFKSLTNTEKGRSFIFKALTNTGKAKSLIFKALTNRTGKTGSLFRWWPPTRTLS